MRVGTRGVAEMDNEILVWLRDTVGMTACVAKEYTALFDEVGLDSLEFFADEEEITGAYLEKLGIRRSV